MCRRIGGRGSRPVVKPKIVASEEVEATLQVTVGYGETEVRRVAFSEA